MRNEIIYPICGSWQLGVKNLSIPSINFLGAHGINTTDGLTDFSLEEAELKSSMEGICR